MELHREESVSLKELAKREDVHIATVYRWSNKGIGGNVLETYRRGGRRFTSQAAFDRFLGKINGITSSLESGSDALRRLRRGGKS